MKKVILHLLLGCLLQAIFTPPARSQSGGSVIEGKIVDAKHQPASYATVTLLRKADSSLAKGAITDDSGNYYFDQIGSGNYMVAASLIGMVKSFSQPFSIESKSSVKSIPALILKPDAHVLSGVQITASKPFITHEIDKTVVNVENSIVSVGSTAWEILQKSPGVTVDNSNNAIQLQGKSGVVVYVNGRSTHLSANQLANLLKNMNAESIRSIEIMTQPSSKYDAAGNAGIINIVTRKNKMTGLNGSVSAGYRQGKYARETAGVDINYRNNKFNFFGSYNFAHSKWWNDNHIVRNFFKVDSKSIDTHSDQYTFHRTPSNSNDFKFGIDYYLDDKNTFGMMVIGSVNPSHSVRKTRNDFTTGIGTPESYSLSRNTGKDNWNNFTYDLNYQGRYDTSGKELNVDVAYSRFDNSSLNHYMTHSYYPDGSLIPDEEGHPNPNIRKGSLPSVIDIKSAKIDYTLPLKKKMKLGMGLKSSWVTSDNDVVYNILDNSNDTWLNDSASNHFYYKENINAAYINWNKEWSHGWGVQLGLRGEQTVTKGYQYTNDSTVKRNYFQLFPTAFISKKLDKNNVLNLSYSRRIDRPDYQSLNPFRYYLDPYTYGQGNPFLQPQLSNSFKLSYSFKSWLSTSLSYTNTTDVMTEVLEQNDSTHVTYQTNRNLSKMQNFSWETNLSIPVTKWWMSNNYMILFNNHYQGEFLGSYLNFSRVAFMLNTTNTFTLPKGFKAELTGFYRSPAQFDIFYSKGKYMVSAGIQKSILHNQADIKLSMNDILHSQNSAASIKYQNLDVKVHNHWDSQFVSFTFTYRFKNGNTKPMRQHQSSIEAEQNRIKK